MNENTNNNTNDNKEHKDDEDTPPPVPPSFDPVQMIRTRRYGTRPHTQQELTWWIHEFTHHRVPEYQMAAWLMAACFRPLSPAETAHLTHCMVQSGRTMEWTLGNNLVDKHSTGGVGDKVSLLLAPLVATLGVHVPMVAGRGLGHTGGTIDKLECISGFRTNLSVEEFQSIVAKVGCCINAAGPDLCPADQRLYALRDVTCTVESIPLQTASIMCKKIAENPASLVLDVKYGNGAFNASPEDAAELAQSMVFTGESNGLNPTTAFLTQMHQPLGYAVGNWYEVQECLELLQGHEDKRSYDLVALMCVQAGQMLQQSGVYDNQSLDELTTLAYDTLRSGKALDKFVEMALAQGADPTKQDTLWYPLPEQLYPPHTIVAPTAGRLVAVDTMQLGWLAVALGAGRRVAHEPVDPWAGLLLHVKMGERVQQGDTLVQLYAPASKLTPHVRQQAADCFTLSNDNDSTFVLEPVVTHRVTQAGGVEELPMSSLPQVVQQLYNAATQRCHSSS